MNLLTGLLGTLVLGIAWPAARAAQDDEPAKYSLRIASQRLDESLQEFARQSGIQIIYFSRITKGLRAPALDGRYTVAEAMTALLADSKLTFRVINAKTIEVRAVAADAPEKTRAPPVPPPRRSSGRDRSSGLKGGWQKSALTEEVIVIGTAQGLVATRTATPLRDIPQTISIISREQLRQQNDTDLAEALSHAPGITSVRTDSLGQQFYSRGFPITSFHIDGGAALSAQLNTTVLLLGVPDLSEFDRIEVLRGADALFGGNGNPGGTVSLVRKRPLDTYSFTLDATVGSWNKHRIEVDITGPLALDGALRGRVDGLYAEKDYFYDRARFERSKIFGVLEYDATPSTLLTAGGSYQWDAALPVTSGLPHYADGTDPRLPRETALTFDWAHYDTRIREVYLQLRQDLGENWRLRFNASSWKAAADYGDGGFGSAMDPVTSGLSFSPSAEFTTRPTTLSQATADVTLTGSFDWFGRRTEVAIGGDFTRRKLRLDSDFFLAFGRQLSSVYTYDAADYPDPSLTQDPTLHALATSTLDQGGVFGSMRVQLNEDWSVLGGARLGSDSIDSTVTLSAGSIAVSQSASFGNSDVITPYAGIMYDVSDHYSLYASYADIYLTAGNSQRPDGSSLGAVRGVNIEAGIKGSWRGGALNGALVLYRISQTGLPLPLPRPPGASSYCCYQAGTNRSRGIEAELGGEIVPGWLIGAGYTRNVNEAASGGQLSSVTPRHLLKVWTSKELYGSLERWTVGGAIHAQTSYSRRGSYCSPTACTTFDVVEDDYAVIDLRVGFQIDQNWQAALSVNNVLDQVYYQTLGEALVDNWYGEPRSFVLRIDGRY